VLAQVLQHLGAHELRARPAPLGGALLDHDGRQVDTLGGDTALSKVGDGAARAAADLQHAARVAQQLRAGSVTGVLCPAEARLRVFLESGSGEGVPQLRLGGDVVLCGQGDSSSQGWPPSS
jgi:hypothetical protein